MSESNRHSSTMQVVLGVLALLAVGIGAWLFFESRGTWPRGEALAAALRPLIERDTGDQTMVARAILDNFQETRKNATLWSGVFWGFTFAAATFSALAGLILKFETIVRNEGLKKDIAAVLSVAAALIVTIASSGDFQRKWQANRIAAAELERIGYAFLEKNGADARSYMGLVGETLYRRHLAVVGGSDERPLAPGSARKE